jgi:hypothetical protein
VSPVVGGDVLGEKFRSAKPHTERLLTTSKMAGQELNAEKINCKSIFFFLQVEGRTISEHKYSP